MITLTNNDLYEIKGGGFKWGLTILFGAAISFLAGIVDGFLNPTKCNR